MRVTRPVVTLLRLKLQRDGAREFRELSRPAKFFGDQLVTIERYDHDEANTYEQIRMLMKTGGSDPTTGPPSGIHWHTATGHSVEFVATGAKLQEIPWVRLVDHQTAEERIYRSDGIPHTDPPPEGIRRTIDCMDCHNRPTHVFRSPDRAMDAVLNIYQRLRSLPFAKREAVTALARPYESTPEAEAGIAGTLNDFYRSTLPGVWESRRSDVDLLTSMVTQVYRSNFFPHMNVTWRTYPDNIGHKDFPGCFRCHNGKHVDAGGRVISRECSSCHDFLLPDARNDATKAFRIGEFDHPTPLEGMHAALSCDRCHTGGARPPSSCEGCHSDITEFLGGKLDAFSEFGIKRDPMYPTVQCEDCHDLSEPMTIENLDVSCMDCHEEEEERFQGMLAAWKREVDDLLDLAEAKDTLSIAVLEKLRSVGPLHNIEASRAILQSGIDAWHRDP